MRFTVLCAAALGLASPAFAQTAADTLKEVVAKGQSMTGTVGGTEVTFSTTFSTDGAYTTKLDLMDRTMTGKWRIDGDKLCTTGGDNSTEDCTAYPAGKKSGDTFDVEHPRLGPAKVTIK
jgi:hypothetical protein